MNERPIPFIFELPFKRRAFHMLQEALLLSGAKIILSEPPWNKEHSHWSSGQIALTEALCEIGNMYHQSVPEI